MPYEVQLSFLPFHEPFPTLRVFRRERAPDEKSPSEDVHAFWLRATPKSEKTDKNYWTSFLPKPSFDNYQADARESIALTKRWLLEALDAKCQSVFGQQGFHRPQKRIQRQVAITIAKHPTGEEQIVF